MKSLLKFALLSALIVTGKLAKQSSNVAVAQAVENTTAPDSSIIFVNHWIPAETTKPNQEKSQPEQGGIDMLANMF